VEKQHSHGPEKAERVQENSTMETKMGQPGRGAKEVVVRTGRGGGGTGKKGNATKKEGGGQKGILKDRRGKKKHRREMLVTNNPKVYKKMGRELQLENEIAGSRVLRNSGEGA